VRIVELDVRGLSHPEPLERAVAAFDALAEDEALHLRIHRMPIPLLQIAEGRGLRYEALEVGEGDFHLLFARDEGGDLQALLRECCGV